MFRVIMFLSVALTLLASPARAETTIKVVADEWPPFGGVDLPNGGISLDVITTVLRRAGYNVTSEILPWERALAGTRSGSYDVIGNLFHDPAMEKYLSYGDPFYQTEVRFIQQKGNTHSYTDLESLRPYSIATGAGYLYEDGFDAADFLNKIVVTTTIQGIRMVANGRADLTLDSIDVIKHAIRQNDPTLAEKIEVLPNALTKQQIHMAVRLDLPDRAKLIADFNRVLGEMRADGSLEQLLAKHRS